jgi:predicted phage terminase large subunit-like protein
MTLAEKFGRRSRDLLPTAEYQMLFPETVLSGSSTAASNWATTVGGEYYAAGSGAGILGLRADLVLLDDPISGFEDAQSVTLMDRLRDWFAGDLTTRMKPSGKRILICQRLARNDLAGHLIDQNKVNPVRRLKVLKLRMEADSSDGEADLLGRVDGERLWPEYFTQQMVDDAKRDDYKWKTLYQQEPPSDAGAWVSTDDIVFAESPALNSEHACYLVCDLALSVNEGDYTVFIVLLHDRRNNVIYMVDMYRARVDPEESSGRLVAMCKTWRPLQVLIDDDNAAKVFMQLVATRARSDNVVVSWKQMPMRGQNKEVRAAALRGMFKRRIMRMDPAKPWTPTVVNELLQFPNAVGKGVDDCVDALSLIGRRLTALASPAAAPAPPPAPKYVQDSMTLDELWADQPRRSTRI